MMNQITDKVLPVCDLCAKPIIEKGGLDINPAVVMDTYIAWHKWEREIEGQMYQTSDMPDLPEHHWRTAHWECTGDDDTYWIEWDRINSPEKAMGWTKHLSGKVWFSHTDWFDLMSRLGYAVYA